MGYAGLVRTNVGLAFDMLGDLVGDVIFHRNDVSGFDFSTKQNVTAPAVSTTVQAIVQLSKKQSKKRNVVNKSLLLQTVDLPDVTSYDTVEISGQIWNVGKPILDDGYVVTLEIYREV